ncbi:MAG: MotA/TolQ/ExbB proton channel family protein, partial [Dolichospermum sp.]
MEISNLFQAGGIVMWPLLFFSVLGVALIIERITFWVKISNRQNRIVQVVLKVYRQGNM